MAGPLILLVDDAPDVGLIVRRLGQRAGQQVEVRPSAELGWEYLQSARPDLAILDVNLPGASGPDLCRQIRGQARLADLPVALLGQMERPDDIAAGLDAGVDFVFSKDLLILPGAWIQRVEEALAGGSTVLQAWPTDGCPDVLHGLTARLGSTVLAALQRRIRGDASANTASNQEALRRELVRVLGSQWCDGLWTAPAAPTNNP